MKNTLKYTFIEFINDHQLIQKGQRVLAAVSGGVDSMVLFDLLCTWRQYFDMQIGVAHFNHLLRGAAAEADAEFVRVSCTERGIPCWSESGAVREFAKEEKLSLEEAARIKREGFLLDVAEIHGFDRIATGHHLNDQAETVLMRLIGGAGIEGLSGIRLKRGKFIRPLLFASRTQIEKWAEVQEIDFREDETNADTDFVRNRIRSRLLPFLQNEFGFKDLTVILNNSLVLQEWLETAQSEIQNVVENMVSWPAENKIRLDIAATSSYFSGIQLRVLENIIGQLIGARINLSFNKFRDFRRWLAQEGSKRRFCIHEGVYVRHKMDHLLLEKENGLN